MIRVVTPAEMADLDKKAMSEGKITGLILMENAALGVSRVVYDNLADNHAPVVILAGIGNNGGDGFCVARHLAMEGIRSIVYLIGKEEKISGDALVNWEIIKERKDVEINLIDKSKPEGLEEKLSLLKKDLAHSQVIVDALLGTGIKGGAREPIASVILNVNQIKDNMNKKVISVDIPSGVMGYRGGVEGPAVKADITVTFALPKYGHFIYPGKEHTGKLYLCNIGISPEIVSGYFSRDSKESSISEDSCSDFHSDAHWKVTSDTDLTSPNEREKQVDTYYIEEKDVPSLIPLRKGNAHKGDFGHILVVAGSRGMLGASYLTVQGALRSGTGLVTAAVPESEQRSLQTKLNEGMTLPLSSKEGAFHEDAFEDLKSKLTQFDVVAIGPGIRNNTSTQKLVNDVLNSFEGSIVVDADGLNALSSKWGKEELKNLFANRSHPVVLTPHVGELERLSQIPKEEILNDPINILSHLVRDWKVHIILKGAPTYLAVSEGKIYIVDRGNPGMATGGSGDVLTGILASFLARKKKTEKASEASILGVYLHGLSGDIAKEDKGTEGLLAGDLFEYLPLAIRKLTEGNIEKNKEKRGNFLGLLKLT